MKTECFLNIKNHKSNVKTDNFLGRVKLMIRCKVAKGFDSGLLTGMILIDLQKAFDTIDHKI